MTETNQDNGVQRPATDRDHHERINRVIRYIREHLNEPLSLEWLARVAFFSPYHFHRIFAANVGETLGEYVRRERLHDSARRLIESDATVATIGMSCGYDTAAAFTKAFKRHFGVVPSVYRMLGAKAPALDPPRPFNRPHIRRLTMEHVIRELPDLRALCVTRTTLVDGNFSKAASEAFPVLVEFMGRKGLFPSIRMCVGICPDDPSTVPSGECRYLAGVVFAQDVEPEGEMTVEVLPAGKWAVFTHKGPYEMLGEAWNAVYRDWLPTSGVTLRDTPPFEAYINDKSKVPPEELLTEIFLPVE